MGAQWELRCPVARTDQWCHLRSHSQCCTRRSIRAPSPTFLTALQTAFRTSTGSSSSVSRYSTRRERNRGRDSVSTRHSPPQFPLHPYTDNRGLNPSEKAPGIACSDHFLAAGRRPGGCDGCDSGGMFLMGGTVFRYAKMALRSLSVSSANESAGIGGRIGRPVPRWTPFLSALTKVSTSHAPRPVSGSGVRLGA